LFQKQNPARALVKIIRQNAINFSEWWPRSTGFYWMSP
jgi:hypothetical protein